VVSRSSKVLLLLLDSVGTQNMDGLHQSCLSYIATGNPTDAQSVSVRARLPAAAGSNTTPCQSIGNVLGASATATGTAIPNLGPPPLTSRPVSDPNFQACTAVDRAWSACDAATPGFGTLSAFSLQAGCLCYSGLVWAPQTFDGRWSSCVNFMSTGDPARYSYVQSGQGGSITTAPCSIAGDVRAGTAAQSTTARPTRSTTSVIPDDRGLASSVVRLPLIFY